MESVKKMSDYHYKANGISKNRLGEILRLNIEKLHGSLEYYSIKPIPTNRNSPNNAILYLLEDVNFLLNKQKEMYQYYLDNYYIFEELKAFGIGTSSNAYKKLTNHEIPHLIRIDKFHTKWRVYLKKEVVDILDLKHQVEQVYTYTKSDLSNKLQITSKNIHKIEKEYNIRTLKLSGEVRFTEGDVNFLVEIQQKLYEPIISNDYYTYDDIKKLKLRPRKFQSYPIPLLARIKELENLRVYYKKDEIDKVINQKNNIVSIKELSKSLNLSKYNTIKALKENQIELLKCPYYIQVKGVTKPDYNKLLNKQTEEYSLYEEMYYTYKEVTKLEFREFGYSSIETIFVGIRIPALILIKKFRGIKFGYPKTEIQTSIQKRKAVQQQTQMYKEIQSILKDTYDPYGAYKKILKLMDIQFSTNCKLTKKYWDAFVRESLLTSKGSEQTLDKRIKRFADIAKFLSEITLEKEFFSFTAKELNLQIFNDNIYLTFQEEIFRFINKINNHLPNNYIYVNDIRNPYEIKRKKQIDNKPKLYTPNEYIELLNYVTDVPLHKKLALEDTEKAINGMKDYKQYDSAWLYVLLHMNNGWRHSDVTKFPRVALNDLPVSNLDDFKNYDFSYEEAKRVIQKVRIISATFIHFKNKKRRHFFCSEELILPLANAIVICELRVRLTNPVSDTLIDFNNDRNDMRKGTHNAFFAHFKNDYKFGSLMMNRTFITLMENVIKKKFNRNSLEILKHIRNHSNIETTNIYVHIPQEHINFITRQLFDVGYFGYNYEVMADILLEESVGDRKEQTRSSLLVKEIFGDIYKLETLASSINSIEKAKLSVKQYLEDLDENMLREKFDLINLGLLPAKEQDYQCIYGKCIFEDRECNKCPLSIPHLYALSHICKRVSKTVKSFEALFIRTSYHGEKTRLANLLYADLLLIKHAKEKFGQAVIDEFISSYFEDYETFRKAVTLLTNPSEYITIRSD